MIDIDISDALNRPGVEFSFLFEGSPVFDGIVLDGPLSVRAKYKLEDNLIRVSGDVSARIRGACSRCLTDVSTDLHESFEELFSERAQDEYIFSREAKRLTLDSLVRDIMIASVPIQILCRDDCKGLCPQCGADLNQEPCGCADSEESTATDANPFSVLETLF